VNGVAWAAPQAQASASAAECISLNIIVSSL
jgi:hypothetical protein